MIEHNRRERDTYDFLSTDASLLHYINIWARSLNIDEYVVVGRPVPDDVNDWNEIARVFGRWFGNFEDSASETKDCYRFKSTMSGLLARLNAYQLHLIENFPTSRDEDVAGLIVQPPGQRLRLTKQAVRAELQCVVQKIDEGLSMNAICTNLVRLASQAAVAQEAHSLANYVSEFTGQILRADGRLGEEQCFEVYSERRL